MDLINIAYLVSSVLFIVGLKMLGSARTARSGNLIALFGMLVAMVGALFEEGIIDFSYILAGLAIGTLIGVVWAKRVQMTEMPQFVALFNGFGGMSSFLVALVEFINMSGSPALDVSITLVLSLLVGMVTFTGSYIAYAKLQGTLRSSPISIPYHQAVNLALLVVTFGAGVVFVLEPALVWPIVVIGAASAILGVLFVIPIGGADMPVVISLLNSYSGIAAAMTGFVLSNNVLIISGALVGASGIILTDLMCKAMNRSLANVLFGRVGATARGETVERHVTRYTPDDVVMVLEKSDSVIMVPGYGLAVSQAQYAMQEIAANLEQRGVKVRYAVHPVAGRMPGHMNVLLAEANVSYDQIKDMEEINDEFAETDVAFVVGANDVVNPQARTKKDSVLYGMPILNVDRARTVIIVKRSLAAGFAGEDNPLFYDEKTMMVFGDAKEVLNRIAGLLKSA
jgi:NAD(P) transhydrogenase subunit beta